MVMATVAKTMATPLLTLRGKAEFRLEFLASFQVGHYRYKVGCLWDANAAARIL